MYPSGIKTYFPLFGANLPVSLPPISRLFCWWPSLDSEFLLAFGFELFFESELTSPRFNGFTSLPPLVFEFRELSWSEFSFSTSFSLGSPEAVSASLPTVACFGLSSVELGVTIVLYFVFTCLSGVLSSFSEASDCGVL